MTQPRIEVQVDGKWFEQYVEKYIADYCERFLRPEWFSIKDLERITGKKRNWIMENIINDPFVRKYGIAKRAGEGNRSEWIIDAEKIRPFLRRFVSELPEN